MQVHCEPAGKGIGLQVHVEPAGKGIGLQVHVEPAGAILHLERRGAYTGAFRGVRRGLGARGVACDVFGTQGSEVRV